ncbi:hypothetical protein ACNQGB_15905 [Flavobacterium sp. XS1P32]|uniref:hypothetical protein n=1 Tax=Flavobacterium sp. XS1P32 TaxID=3401726 RepID=UPI003AAB79F1
MYSCQRNSAPTKAVAVCPDGKEYEEPSGRSMFVIRFNAVTEVKTNKKDVAKITLLSFKLFFPCIP